MSPRKPDRWERKVARGFPWNVVRPQDLMSAKDAIKLLRAEHRAVVGLVVAMKNQLRLNLTADFPTTKAYRRACDEILVKLKERER